MLSKYRTSYFATNLLIQAAEETGYKVKIISAEHDLIEIHDSQNKSFIRIIGQTIDINNMVSATIADNKHLTAIILSELGAIIPKHELIRISSKKITSKHEEFKLVKNAYIKFKKKVVIKPTNLSGGAGITILPKSDQEIVDAINQLKKLKVSRLMVEEYVTANKEYRLLCLKGTILDVVERIPANVVGDGEKSIKQLLDDQMDEREKYGLKGFTDYQIYQGSLSLKKMNLRSIPKKDQQIWLENKCNWSLGGTVTNVPLVKVHSDYKKLIKKIYRLSHLAYNGLDLMTDDISKPIDVSTHVNEINSKPGFFINYFADCKNNVSLRIPKKILKHILNDRSSQKEKALLEP